MKRPCRRWVNEVADPDDDGTEQLSTGDSAADGATVSQDDDPVGVTLLECGTSENMIAHRRRVA